MIFIRSGLRHIALGMIGLQMVSVLSSGSFFLDSSAWAMNRPLLLDSENQADTDLESQTPSAQDSEPLPFTRTTSTTLDRCYQCDLGKCYRIARQVCRVSTTLGVLLVLAELTKVKYDHLYAQLDPSSPKPWDHEIATNRFFYDQLLEEYWKNKHDLLGPDMALAFDGLLVPVFMLAHAKMKHPSVVHLYTGLLCVFSTAYFAYSAAPILDMNTNLDAMEKNPILLNRQVGRDFFLDRREDAKEIVLLVGMHAAMSVSAVFLLLDELGYRRHPLATD